VQRAGSAAPFERRKRKAHPQDLAKRGDFEDIRQTNKPQGRDVRSSTTFKSIQGRRQASIEAGSMVNNIVQGEGKGGAKQFLLGRLLPDDRARRPVASRQMIVSPESRRFANGGSSVLEGPSFVRKRENRFVGTRVDFGHVGGVPRLDGRRGGAFMSPTVATTGPGEHVSYGTVIKRGGKVEGVPWCTAIGFTSNAAAVRAGAGLIRNGSRSSWKTEKLPPRARRYFES